MEHRRPTSFMIAWLLLIFLLLVLGTGALFMVLIAEPSRNTTFYIALALVITAELVFFAHLLHAKLIRAGCRIATPVTRAHIHVLIFVWLLTSVITAVMVLDPVRAETAASVTFFVIELVLTVFFFFVAYLIYNRESEVEPYNRELDRMRNKMRLNTEPVEAVMRHVTQLALYHTEQAIRADQVLKKLKIVRDGFDTVLVSERTMATPEEQERVVRLQEEVARLQAIISSGIPTITPLQVQATFEQIGTQSDLLIALLQQHQRSALSA